MPEGPELYFASRFINSICKSRIFSGEVKKSDVSKCPDVKWNSKKYTISAQSRGKELKLTLKNEIKGDRTATGQEIDLIFKFGMSGRFRFDPVDEMHKHAHLTFFTQDKKMILSFVDPRRFGSWELGDWGRERGPCILSEYQKFRENVQKNLQSSVFNKPICEVLLNQKYFNGVGNYLRAEILYRAGIPPFVKARDVLETLDEDVPADVTTDSPDVLQLCHTVATEVTNLTNVSGYDANTDPDEASAFSQWLRCYFNPDMKNMVDHNKRTIWYSGDPGPMAPKDAKERYTKKPRKQISKAAFKSSVPTATGDNVLSKEVKSVDVTGHMSHDHDYREAKVKRSKARAKSSEGKATAAKISRKVSEQSTISIDPSMKRTNAHDWPTSPRKLRSNRNKPTDTGDLKVKDTGDLNVTDTGNFKVKDISQSRRGTRRKQSTNLQHN